MKSLHIKMVDITKCAPSLIDPSFLPPDRVAKFLAFHKEEDRLRSYVASCLVEAYVGKGEWRYNQYGKPYKEGKARFNLSHSGNLVVLVYGEEDVGIDIEQKEEFSRELANASLTKEELSEAKDAPSFYVAWTRKEACAKCLGTGLSEPNAEGVKEIGHGKVSFLGEEVYVCSYLFEGYCLSLAKKKPFKDYDFEIVALEEALEIIKAAA